jgi:hypothetical protein
VSVVAAMCAGSATRRPDALAASIYTAGAFDRDLPGALAAAVAVYGTPNDTAELVIPFLRCDERTDALLLLAQGMEELGLGLALTHYVSMRDEDAVSAAWLLLRLWGEGGHFSALHQEAVRAPLLSFGPKETGFGKRYLALVLRQWELAGHPVPQEWVDRAHALIDTRAPHTAKRSLLEELPQPPS